MEKIDIPYRLLETGIKATSLIGPGGTGKSEIIKELCQRQRPGSVLVCAPTREALNNIKSLIQKNDGNRKHVDKVTYDKRQKYKTVAYITGAYHDSDGWKRCEIKREKRLSHIMGGVRTMIVDESSMVCSEQAESIIETVKKYGLHLICVGDACQLPPVKESSSLLFIPEFYKHHLGFVQETITLTKIHRQQSEGNYNEVIYQVREWLLSLEGRVCLKKRLESIPDDNTFSRAYSIDILDKESSVILCYTNSAVNHYARNGFNAITVHKAQGKSYGHVIIDVYDIAKSQQDFGRLVYTAVSRARKELTFLYHKI